MCMKKCSVKLALEISSDGITGTGITAPVVKQHNSAGTGFTTVELLTEKSECYESVDYIK